MKKSKKKKPYKVWQDEQGNWCVSHRDFPKSWAIGKTLEEAMDNHRVFMADFEQMKQHHNGICPEGCRWCVSHPNTKGVFERKVKSSATA